MSTTSNDGYVLLPACDDPASQAIPSPTLLATWTWEDALTDDTLFFPRTPRQLEEAPTSEPPASVMLDAFFTELFFAHAPAPHFHPYVARHHR